MICKLLVWNIWCTSYVGILTVNKTLQVLQFFLHQTMNWEGGGELSSGGVKSIGVAQKFLFYYKLFLE